MPGTSPGVSAQSARRTGVSVSPPRSEAMTAFVRTGWGGPSARTTRLPARDHATTGLLREEGVAEVVPPAAVDVQVAAEQPLLTEAEPFDQPPARPVLRADVGLQPVQPGRAERVIADQRHGQ